MPSVAGQIRIDLLANAAGFNAGLREAGRSLGGFTQEAEKVDRAMNSKKRVGERIQKEKDAWGAALKEIRPEIAAGRDKKQMLPWYSLERMNLARDAEDIQRRNEMRLKGMLPWGMSMRTTMSREAMLTAQAIGEQKQTVVNALAKAGRELGVKAADGYGLGGAFRAVGGFAAAHPLAAAATVAGGFMLKTMMDRDDLARQTRANASILGQGVEDTSRLTGVGFERRDLSLFQRSISERSAGFGRLGLNADALGSKPLIEALKDVSAGFERIKNPADRASAAMQLFGRGGAEVLATLNNLQAKLDDVSAAEIVKPEDVERTKAWDTSLKNAKNTLAELSIRAGKMVGMESGIGTHIARTVEGLSYYLTGDMEGFDKAESRWKKQDRNIAQADQIEKARVQQARLADEAERYAKAQQRAGDAVQSLRDRLADMASPGASERRKFIEGLAGLKPAERANRIAEYDAMQGQIKQGEHLKGIQGQYESSMGEDPRWRLQKNLADLEFNFAGIRETHETQYQALRQKHLRDYYREAEGLDARQIRARLGTEHDRYRQGLANLMAHGEAAGLAGSEVQQEAARRRIDERRRLLGPGSDTLGDFARDVQERRQGLASGTIGRGEYADWRRSRMQSAAGELVGNRPQVQLSAAMAAGSESAHALIAQASTNDPALKAQMEAVTVLNRIAAALEAGQAISEEQLRALKEAMIL